MSKYSDRAIEIVNFIEMIKGINLPLKSHPVQARMLIDSHSELYDFTTEEKDHIKNEILK